MKSESRAYHVWSENEEQALREGVRRYGVGSWELIRQDKSFAILKYSRCPETTVSDCGSQATQRCTTKRQVA